MRTLALTDSHLAKVLRVVEDTGPQPGAATYVGVRRFTRRGQMAGL